MLAVRKSANFGIRFFSKNAVKAKPRVVVIGTGWAGFRFVTDIDRKAYDVTVISTRDHFLFTPLLASTTVGTLEYRSIIEPIRLIRNLQFYQAEVRSIDVERKAVVCHDWTHLDETETKFEIPFDYLFFGVGAYSATFNIPGVKQYAFFVKQIADARAIRSRLSRCLERADQPHVTPEEQERILHWVVVGGGPTCVEFAAELYDLVNEDVRRWYPRLHNKIRITMLEATDHILGAFDASLADRAVQTFRSRNIHVRTQARVKAVHKDHIELDDGSTLPCGFVAWSTGIAPNPLTRTLPFPRDVRTGRLLLSEHLSVGGRDDIFAAGDCAHPQDQPLPATAQVASQQGAYIARLFNRTAAAGGPAAGGVKQGDVAPFTYRHMGVLAYIGGWQALYDFDHKVRWHGFLTFLFWRSAYWTKNVSIKNKVLIPMMWFKSWLFGRDISQF